MEYDLAFPVPSYVNADGETYSSSIKGMYLRDYFAAKVLNGFLACGDYADPRSTARKAYEFADAMLKEKEKEWDV